MGVVLVNGDGNPAVHAAQDSDLLGGISGQTTGVLDINDKFSATIADANTVEISSGVCITKEGRRIQIDVGDVEEVIVPTGAQGTTKYYIIGFHLYTDASGNQLAETFIDEVASSTATITENMFKDGETEVYVSLYRITRNGLNLEDLTMILQEIPSLGDLAEDVAELSSDLSWKLIDTVTGTTHVSLPSNFRELHIVMKYNSSPQSVNALVMNILKEDLTSNSVSFQVGHCINNNSNFVGGFIYANTTELYLSVLQYNNNALTSSTEVSVYYK